MEVIQHLLGACGDNHSHFDLTDLALLGGVGTGFYAFRYYVKGTYLVCRNYVKKIFN